MNKHLILVLTVALTIALSACDNESGSTYNEFGFYPVNDTPTLIYADQTTDTFTIVSNNSWKATLVSDWASLDASRSYRTLSGDKTEQAKCPINFKPNETEGARYTTVVVSNGKHSISRIYVQSHWLNITEPRISFPASTNVITDISEIDQFNDFAFVKNVSSDSTKTNIAFEIYASQATLSTKSEWIEPQTQVLNKGYHNITLELAPNTSKQRREATLILTTSNGISNEITLVQTK